MAPATLAALQKLGADLAVARLRRKESLRTWAKRLGVTVSTLQRVEAGDPGVRIGIVASALWLMNRDGELAGLAERLDGAELLHQRQTFNADAYPAQPLKRKPISPFRRV